MKRIFNWSIINIQSFSFIRILPGWHKSRICTTRRQGAAAIVILESIQTSTFGPPSAVGRRPSGYFEFKDTNIMLTAVTKRPFSDGPKYQHLQLVTAVSNDCQRCLNWPLEPILRLLNSRLQRQSRSRIERFYGKRKKIKMHKATRGVVYFYSAGVVCI
jgi:hypothetical protein